MDYSDKSLQELYDIYAKMDNELFPDDSSELFELIKSREKQGKSRLTIKSAPRLFRFIAFVIDASIVILIFCILFIILNFTIFDLDLMKIFHGDTNYLSFLFFSIVGITCLIYFLVNAYWLKTKGQTAGKKIMGIKIIDINGNTPSLGRSFGTRFLIPAFIASLPVFGIFLWMIDSLFIFGKNYKCIHDYFADTKVVFSGREIYF